MWRGTLALTAAGLFLLLHMALLATSEPQVRKFALALESFPDGHPPVVAALISDIHAGGADVSPERVAKVVEQVNSLKPDLVLLAGDFISEKKFPARRLSIEESIAPLANLRAPLGTVAVLGNHDHWLSARTVRAALAKSGITVLDNQAVRRGPVALGGVDDVHTRQADMAATAASMARLGGVKLLLSHSPDIFPEVPSDVKLTLAGHTHCGQIAFPLIGAIVTASNYGRRFACGIIEENGRILIVSGGVGTSGLPIRLLARPDIWLITLRSR